MKRFLTVAVALMFLASLSWSKQGAAPSLASVAHADEKDSGGEGWGTIKGQVVFDGDVPEPKEIAAAKDNQDKAHCLSKGPLLHEEWVVNKQNKGVKWALVWLIRDPVKDEEGNLKPNPQAPPIHPNLKEAKGEVEIDQPCCAFVPHMLAMREGQTLVAKNGAPVAHNIKWAGGLKNPGGNVILPPNGQYKIDNLKADRLPIISLNCNIHPWMNAKVGVFNHPYFKVTNDKGEFEIKQAPAGKYRLVVWHEAIGYKGGKDGRFGQEITIRDKDVTDLGKLEIKP